MLLGGVKRSEVVSPCLSSASPHSCLDDCVGQSWPCRDTKFLRPLTGWGVMDGYILKRRQERRREELLGGVISTMTDDWDIHARSSIFPYRIVMLTFISTTRLVHLSCCMSGGLGAIRSAAAKEGSIHSGDTHTFIIFCSNVVVASPGHVLSGYASG